jgi:hypothetical protein
MKNLQISTGLFASLVLVVLLLTACGGGADSADFPTGKFVLPDNEFAGYQFNADGSWSYFFAGTTEAGGKYAVKGDQWIEQGTDECPFPGTYSWTFNGTQLTFKLVGEDECQPRRDSTDGQTFILVK